MNDIIIQTEKWKGQPLFVLTEICSVGLRLPDFVIKQAVYAHHQTTLKLSCYETIECLLHSLWQLHKQYSTILNTFWTCTHCSLNHISIMECEDN